MQLENFPHIGGHGTRLCSGRHRDIELVQSLRTRYDGLGRDWPGEI